MTLRQLLRLENKSKEIWVVSPSLHYDIENEEFTELVSVNLGEKTKYRYIVPATSEIAQNMEAYQKKYGLTKEEMDQNFLLLPASDFNPFITESAIYNPSDDCIACCAPAMEDSNDVIKYDAVTSKNMANSFKSVWKKYRRNNP